MRLLLDTHTIVWLALSPGELSAGTVSLIEKADEVAISVISRWEMGIKAKDRKFPQIAAFDAAIASWGFTILPILREHVVIAADLPLLHRDPFDRMLVAQAIHGDFILLTADRQLEIYPVKSLRA